jgi:hypothetical protein
MRLLEKIAISATRVEETQSSLKSGVKAQHTVRSTFVLHPAPRVHRSLFVIITRALVLRLVLPRSNQAFAHRHYVIKSNAKVYVILLKFDAQHCWTVSHRFSTFDALRKSLERKIGSLPELPPKTWLRSFARDFVEKRREQLETFLQLLLENDAVCNSNELLDFLHVRDNVPSFALLSELHKPTQFSAFQDPRFGCNACFFIASEGLYLTATEDVELMSRVDAQLSNLVGSCRSLKTL